MDSMLTSLVVGASRGLGLHLVKELASKYHSRVFATVRSPPQQGTFPDGVSIIEGVDIAEEGAGYRIVQGLEGSKVDLVIVNAGYFRTETIDKPDFNEEVAMYKTCAIGPVFIAHHLYTSNSFADNAKLILITTEGGSITLRTKEEGGGNYAHHGSKAAGNMVGKLLAHDLMEEGVVVAMIHPGFMRTDMTKDIGFDQFWDSGGAVHPSEAATSTLEFISRLTLKDTGTFWAPRGPGDIGEAERVLGKGLPTPLKLPW